MLPEVLFLLALVFLLGTFFLTALSSAFRSLHKRGSKKKLDALGQRFFYRRFHHVFFPKQEYEGIFFATTCAQHLTRFFFVFFSLLFLHVNLSPHSETAGTFPYFLFWVNVAWIVLVSFIVGDYLPRILGTRYPESMMHFCAPVSSIFLFLAFPITYLFLKLTWSLSRSVYFDHLHEPHSQAKQEIIEIIQEAKFSEELDANQKKLITSLLSFCEHMTREVMVPRVDMFSLKATTTIKEAAKLLHQEGYSRVPVYEENVDNIVGILMYKDVLTKYMEYEEKNNDIAILNMPISSIQKPPLYTPETKKISDLLQEFRKKQTHLAIVVDEYGGTEGLITIENILEDIVGEIVDEYDQDEEELFTAQGDGSWIVDSRMNIIDAEEQLGITIPEEGEYDTIGGYIYDVAGEIPSKGFKILTDEFELEVIKSSERTVEKVRIKPRRKPEDDSLDNNDNDQPKHNT